MKHDLSERHAYRIVGQHRGTQHYVPTLPTDEDTPTRAIVAMASEHRLGCNVRGVGSSGSICRIPAASRKLDGLKGLDVPGEVGDLQHVRREIGSLLRTVFHSAQDDLWDTGGFRIVGDASRLAAIKPQELASGSHQFLDGRPVLLFPEGRVAASLVVSIRKLFARRCPTQAEFGTSCGEQARRAHAPKGRSVGPPQARQGLVVKDEDEVRSQASPLNRRWI
ncbi:hypothetical protein FHR71_005494 [Methylobacterium sp. RAS18]|nr:hypothetical protein [Methylobacterium sp. RAS18]